MPQMKTLKALRYGGRPIAAGEEFEARPKDARLLAALRHAELVAQPAEPVGEAPEQDPDDAAMSSEEAPQDDAKPAAKRKYKRRDMTAE